MTPHKTCPISHLPMQPIFSELVLAKHDVQYFMCTHCGLIQTEEPYWLDDAYQSAISDSDTGILHRNIRARRYLEPLVELLDLGSGKFADVGGGYGVLTRLMRDIGYDCSTYDPYCKNLFAKAFEAREDTAYDALFAFEVLEHLRDPVDFIKRNFSKYGTKTILFSTLAYSKVPDRTWWYYAFDIGQHVTFYQKRTLSLLAEAFGCHYYPINESIHLITDRKVGFLRRAVMKSTVLLMAYAAATRLRRLKQSKIGEDHEHARKALSPPSKLGE